jgi:hypothetical protein
MILGHFYAKNNRRKILVLRSIYENIDFVHGKIAIFIKILDEFRLFNDKKMIFDEKLFSIYRRVCGVSNVV